jgi:hypothetical protein
LLSSPRWSRVFSLWPQLAKRYLPHPNKLLHPRLPHQPHLHQPHPLRRLHQPRLLRRPQ